MARIVNFDKYLKNWINNFNNENNKHISNYDSISLCTSNNAYHILQIQPKANLVVNKQDGIYIEKENEEYNNKLVTSLKKSLNEKYDLVLTPEYSVPLDIVKNLIKNLDDIKVGTLYCLCCTGVTYSCFKKFLKFLKQKQLEIYKNSWESLSENRMVCCLLYITKVKFYYKNGNVLEKVFAIPQFKTRPMKDNYMDFEYDVLSCGNQVIIFGKKNENKFMSIICADVFNYNLIANIKSKLLRQKAIIFHPQLNIRPQNNNFRFARNLLLDYANSDSVRVISLNWAKGTKFKIGEKQNDAITDSWSAIYKGYSFQSFENYLKLLDNNADKGLNFAHDYQVCMFYFPSDEHTLDISMRPLINDSTPEVTRNAILLNINNYYQYDISINDLVDRTDICKEMVDNFFWENKEFKSFFTNNQSNQICIMSKLNEFVSLIYDSKLEKEFEMINNGNVSSVTAKHYRSIYSREKLYICKRIFNKVKSNVLPEKYKYLHTNFTYDVKIVDGFKYNVEYNEEEFGPQLCRIIYLKYEHMKDAEKLYNKLYNNNKNIAENVIIFYEDENGINVFDKNIDTSIIKGEIAQNNASILGGNK